MTITDIFKKLGISQLTPMQQQSYDAIANNQHDVVVLSATGSGKTLAYLLPLISLINTDVDDLQAIVVVPGRELALQSFNVLKSAGTAVRALCCYGGRTAMDEHREIKKVMPHVIFGTPGRLIDHISKGNISPYKVRTMITDEFDKCLQMGFQDEMKTLTRSLPGIRRRILLSATDTEQIPAFVDLKNTIRIDFRNEDTTSKRISLHIVKSQDKDKLQTLADMLRWMGEKSTVVFLNYRDSVVRTASFLTQQGFTVSHFHGGMEQKLREDAIYKFSNGSANILVATDLASRGLDIPDIDNIIHYHLPIDHDSYVHRIGRTARWENSGNAYFILGPEEHLPDFVPQDLQTVSLPDNLPLPPKPLMSTIYIGKGKKDKISKGDILGFLCKKGGLTTADIGRIDVAERYAYAAVKTNKVKGMLNNVKGEKIKGLKTIIEPVK